MTGHSRTLSHQNPECGRESPSRRLTFTSSSFGVGTRLRTPVAETYRGRVQTGVWDSPHVPSQSRHGGRTGPSTAGPRSHYLRVTTHQTSPHLQGSSCPCSSDPPIAALWSTPPVDPCSHGRGVGLPTRGRRPSSATRPTRTLLGGTGATSSFPFFDAEIKLGGEPPAESDHLKSLTQVAEIKTFDKIRRDTDPGSSPTHRDVWGTTDREFGGTVWWTPQPPVDVLVPPVTNYQEVGREGSTLPYTSRFFHFLLVSRVLGSPSTSCSYTFPPQKLGTANE